MYKFTKRDYEEVTLGFKLNTSASMEQFRKELKRFEPAHYSSNEEFMTLYKYFTEKVTPHKIAVYQAGMEMIASDVVENPYKELLGYLLTIHDASKYSRKEALGYAYYNFQTKGGKGEFTKAWHHHKLNNPHHPEYWLNPNKSGKLEVLRMPKMYVYEMVADWIGAGRTYSNSLKNWLPKNINEFLFHHQTAKDLRVILEKIGFDVSFSNREQTKLIAIVRDADNELLR